LSSSCFSTGTRPPALYSLSLHDALPILRRPVGGSDHHARDRCVAGAAGARLRHLPGDDDGAEHVEHHHRPRLRVLDPRTMMMFQDRKSTRLNSSHEWISYAVFCLKNKKI